MEEVERLCAGYVAAGLIEQTTRYQVAEAGTDPSQRVARKGLEKTR